MQFSKKIRLSVFLCVLKSTVLGVLRLHWQCAKSLPLNPCANLGLLLACNSHLRIKLANICIVHYMHAHKQNTNPKWCAFAHCGWADTRNKNLHYTDQGIITRHSNGEFKFASEISSILVGISRTIDTMKFVGSLCIHVTWEE